MATQGIVPKSSYPSGVTRAKTTHLEEIRQYIESRGEYPISPMTETIRVRLETMWKARTDTSSAFKSRKQLLKEHALDFDITTRQAEHDWDDCISLYRHYTNIEPNTELYLTLERYDALINEAREAGKIEAALQALGKRAELVGKLQPDPNKPDFNKVTPQVTALVMDDFTRVLFEKAQAKLGDPVFYQAFLKLVLDIDDALTFDYKQFLDIEQAQYEEVVRD